MPCSEEGWRHEGPVIVIFSGQLRLAAQPTYIYMKMLSKMPKRVVSSIKLCFSFVKSATTTDFNHPIALFVWPRPFHSIQRSKGAPDIKYQVIQALHVQLCGFIFMPWHSQILRWLWWHWTYKYWAICGVRKWSHIKRVDLDAMRMPICLTDLFIWLWSL